MVSHSTVWLLGSGQSVLSLVRVAVAVAVTVSEGKFNSGNAGSNMFVDVVFIDQIQYIYVCVYLLFIVLIRT